MPQLLCKWCGSGDHQDSKCPKRGVNLLSIETCDEERLAITHEQAKKAMYLDVEEEKKRLQQARMELEKQMETKKLQTKDTTNTSKRNLAKQNIIRQAMQMKVPMKLNDLTMPQLRSVILNMTPLPKATEEIGKDGSRVTATDPMLLALTTGRHPAVVEMSILGTVLMDTIVDGGLGVNVLPEDVWKKLGQPVLWPPTFQLLTAD